jgi:hypothetical protein
MNEPTATGSNRALNHGRKRLRADSTPVRPGPRRTVGRDPDLDSSGDEFADLIAESPAIGFVSKLELSADAIRRIVDGRIDVR